MKKFNWVRISRIGYIRLTHHRFSTEKATLIIQDHEYKSCVSRYNKNFTYMAI